MKKILIFAMSLVYSLYSQSIIWEKNFGGPLREWGFDVIPLPDSTFLIVGGGGSPNKSGEVILLKIDREGNAAWWKEFGGEDIDVGQKVLRFPDGKIVLIGYTCSFGNGLTDIYVLYCDEEGNKIWEKTIGGSAQEMVGGADILSNFIIIGGWTRSFGKGEKDMYAVCIDREGKIIWEKTFGGELNDECIDMVSLSNGSVVLVGATESYAKNNPEDIYVVCLDQNGNKLWEKTFGGKGIDVAKGVCATPSNDIIIVGFTTSFNSLKRDGYVIKINSRGKKIWEKTFGGKDIDAFTECVYLPEDDNILVGGATLSYGKNGDIWIINLSSKGKKIWEKTFGGEKMEDLSGMCLFNHKNVILVGATESFTNGATDIYVIFLKIK